MNSLFGFGRPLFRLGLGAPKPASSRRRRRRRRCDDLTLRHGGGLSAADVARRRRGYNNWLRDRHWWRRRRSGRRCLILRRALAFMVLVVGMATNQDEDHDGHADADRVGRSRRQAPLLLALGRTLLAAWIAYFGAGIGLALINTVLAQRISRVATGTLRVAPALLKTVRPEFRRVVA